MASKDSKQHIGLDDKDRVRIIFDRGDDEYRQDHPGGLRNGGREKDGSASGKTLIETIQDELEAVEEYYPKDSRSYFIPREKVREIMSKSRVLGVIRKLACFKHLPSAEAKSLRDSILGDKNPCWKLLAVLIANGKQEDLRRLLEEDVSDHCLPFPFHSSSPYRCRIPHHSHPTIAGWSKKTRIDASCWSYAVKAPYFKRPVDKHLHYVLDSMEVLPILDSGPLKGKVADGDTASGGFGEVKMVRLPPSHFNFGSVGSQLDRRDPQFALKRLFSGNRDSFNKELASLLSFRDKEDDHLIKLLVSFEIQKQSGTEYYLVFPWAQGTLWDFWKRFKGQHERVSLSIWMADQCYHLAKALQGVHNERDQHLRLIQDIDSTQHELYGRHGDVKAENVLWFGKDNNQNFLALTDFGLGRLHTKYSRSGVDPKSVDKSATYKAPEFSLREGLLSRASDIFSLGCTYLEFVTWYLEGFRSAAQEFADYRMEFDPENGFDADIFFSIEDRNTAKERAVVKPKVKEWIKRLRQSSLNTNYTDQFLDLIEERMLEPDSKKRISSSELVKELDNYSIACRSDTDYREGPAKGRKPGRERTQRRL
ncbi:kinase-like domain-containing protein [Podospora didyma]|uniref:Kinase-like domain-containing protein n=1 Tax=Podospora didyma TaxID=330526 RepID=A0AAE0NUY0_9PEZI|nr:kinase-like domain-containing protein [Podospora didyma]